MKGGAISILVSALLLHFASANKGNGQEPKITEHPTDVTVGRNQPVTLNCQASGSPDPSITWYKNGVPVTGIRDQEPHRVLLPSGSLFFLRVRKEQDAGVYHCEARNSAGSARSHDATLSVAVLREEFRVSPTDQRVAKGETVRLPCTSPRGQPPPVVRWLKDDVILELERPSGSAHMRLDGHDLIIKNVTKADEGLYVCEAENDVGVRRTEPAQLTVLVKPFFIKKPIDVTAVEGEEVEFLCKVGGDPLPHVTWRRRNDQVPIGRAQPINDRGLKFFEVLPEDTGVYVCEAENVVDKVTTHATLTVHDKPRFNVKPEDQVSTAFQSVSFSCIASGNPSPRIFWRRQGDQTLIRPGQSLGRLSVTSAGTLTLKETKPEDEGTYVCMTLNSAGANQAKARLIYQEPRRLPPPVIKYGPANQTLPVGSSATLRCEATGPLPVEITWRKDGEPLRLDHQRMTLERGSLIIKDLWQGDGATYTCVATSDSGQTTWSSRLRVEKPQNPNVMFHKSSDPVTFPGPPSRPNVVNVTKTSVTLMWDRSPRVGPSNIIGYMIEYHNMNRSSGWERVGYSITSQVYTIDGLHPEEVYVFIVRSENSHGLSPPSPISEKVYTGAKGSRFESGSVTESINNPLDGVTVKLERAQAVSPDSVRLSWKVTKGSADVEGFYIRYTEAESESPVHILSLVLSREEPISTYVVRALNVSTNYEFFLVPFIGSFVGIPSNLQTVQTMEGAPSASPILITVRLLNGSSALASWEPPAARFHNGILLGYQVRLSVSGEEPASSVSSNATRTSIVFHSLNSTQSYVLRVAAFTKAGMGPFSTPVEVKIPGPHLTPHLVAGDSRDVAQEAWFIGLIGGLMFILLGVFVVIISIRRRQANKFSTGGFTESQKVPGMCYLNGGKENLWLEPKWRRHGPGEPTGNPGEDSEKKALNGHGLDSSEQQLLLTGGNPSNTPIPYASTAVIQSYLESRSLIHSGNGSPSPVPDVLLYDNAGQFRSGSHSGSSCKGRAPTLMSFERYPQRGSKRSLTSTGSQTRRDNNNEVGGVVLDWSEIIPPPPPPAPENSSQVSFDKGMGQRGRRCMYRRVPFQGLNSLPTPSMMEGVCEEQIQGQGPMQDRCIQSSLPSLLPNPHEQRLDEISGAAISCLREKLEGLYTEVDSLYRRGSSDDSSHNEEEDTDYCCSESDKESDFNAVALAVKHRRQDVKSKSGMKCDRRKTSPNSNYKAFTGQQSVDI